MLIIIIVNVLYLLLLFVVVVLLKYNVTNTLENQKMKNGYSETLCGSNQTIYDTSVS